MRDSTIIEAEAGDSAGLPETYRRLAYWLEGYLDKNEPLINRRFRAYRWATGSVLVQVVLWVMEIVF